MDPNASSPDISFEFPTLFRIYKDGRVERLKGTEVVPPSTDPETGVRSKDIVLSLESGLSARIFLPKLPDPTRKLPSLFSSTAALSRAPEHPLPVAYEDSWEALQWAAAHSNRNGPETWLNDHVDFDRVFVGGDSAGATLTNHVVHRAGVHGLSGAKIVGMILFHPYFGNEKPNKLLEVIFPACSGLNDTRDRAWAYYEALKKSGWGGVVEIVESEGEDHVFHLFNPSCDKAVEMVKKVVSFINQD
ncbi:putative carboxylesterase 12 [Prunus yedoensis var. nudiflora]|uniref:Putative carboxylesterase 12 n=1 Tax=Prunus yedoensis var. nudiflora TaxID=2094558 RepID=A0A314XZM6_PRUYE|nr:putative carboxylesterase 12 [Prunus yedoensis var. nudiflora]